MKSKPSPDALNESVDALMARWTGCLDSGADDTELKEAVKTLLHSMISPDRLAFPDAFDVWVSDYAANMLAMRDQGYGLADVKAFIDWLEEEMGIEV